MFNFDRPFTFENLEVGDRVVYDARHYVAGHYLTGNVATKYTQDNNKLVVLNLDKKIWTENKDYCLSTMVVNFDFVFPGE